MNLTPNVEPFCRSDGTPLYIQLQQMLRNAIHAKILAEDDALPAERDLATKYSVSRITVRKAVDGLVEEGLITRKPGSGTFVATRVEKSFAKLSSFSEDMIARGRMPTSEWIMRVTGSVTPKEALAMGLSPGSQVYRFHRLRFADGVPMALEMSTIAGECLPSQDAVEVSLYAALEATGHRPIRALQRVRSVGFAGDHARMLGVPTGHAGLLIERRGFLGEGRAIELTQSFYRGDAYDFVAELTA